MDPTNGITCPDMRRVVREALGKGWTWGGMTGSTHARIVWPATGDSCVFGMTPSVASWKSLATDVRRISGVEVWRKGNRKRSHKAFRPSGFSTDAARREADAWASSGVGARVEELRGKHAILRVILDLLVEQGDRNAAARFRELLPRAREIEDELTALHYPVDRYQPGVSRAS